MNKIIVLLIILTLICCNSEKSKNTQKQEILIMKESEQEILQLFKKYNCNKILFIPENSCSGCFQRTIKDCDKLANSKNIKLFYINELELEVNDCMKSLEASPLKEFYTNYEIYGITLFENYNNTLKITYIDPSNIDSIYYNLIIF